MTAAGGDVAAVAERRLSELRPGEEGIVVGIQGGGQVRTRLLEMGFCCRERVLLERRAPLGDPLEFRLRGYHLSLRRHEAERILVEVGTEAVPPPAPPDPLPLRTESWQPPARGEITIALAGNPNVGKTTLFNRITGLHQHVANYPGVTIERTWGHVRLGDELVANVVDLPGAYSLTPTAPDENIAMEVLAGLLPDEPMPDVILLAVDATSLPRNLLFFSQLADLGRPVVVALNKMDLARAEGRLPVVEDLEKLLGVPVVPVVARTGEGMAALRRALGRARIPVSRPWNGLGDCCEEMRALTESLREMPVARRLTRSARRTIAHHLAVSSTFRRAAALRDRPRLQARLDAFDRHCRECDHDYVGADIDSRYRWIATVLARTVPGLPQYRPTLSDRLDRWLLQPVTGLVTFVAVMFLLFLLVFAVAGPLVAWTEAAIGWVGARLGGWLPDGPIRDAWLDGVVEGVGGVLSFVPQIAIMLTALALLETSGYLARGAFLLDRLLSRVGLHGKSFIPLLSCHACAVPGIMGTRGIDDARERLRTILVAPFMACQARLIVYLMLIRFLLADSGPMIQAMLLIALYAFGIVLAVAVSLLLRSCSRGDASSFMLELPRYAWPDPRSVLRSVRHNLAHFLRKAGTVIFAFSLLLWAGTTWPRLPADAERQLIRSAGADPAAVRADVEAAPPELRRRLAAARLRHSAVGRAGRFVEPALTPLGYDWKIGVALLTAFGAREMFLGSLGVLYASGEEDEAAMREAMRADRRADGSPLWTPLVGLSLLVWFAIALQCLPTTAVVRRETGSWAIAGAQLLAYNALAWLVCLAIWQLFG